MVLNVLRPDYRDIGEYPGLGTTVRFRTIAGGYRGDKVNFQDLEQRLVDHLRELVRCGDLTERGLARLTGLSQPHIHNVLHRKRSLSSDSADLILHVLHLDLLDLLPPGARRGKPPGDR